MEEIKNRIDKADSGSIFVTSDFTDLTSSTTARKCLGRLVEANIIYRVMDGVYEKRKYSHLLKEYIPTNPDSVAKAIAKHYHWTISPSGDVALNKLGLSTQVPVVWSYISDGPYRDYKYGEITIVFKHRANRNISNLSSISIMYIEALKVIGKERIDERIINVLKNNISLEDKIVIMMETRNSPEWIREITRKVCE